MDNVAENAAITIADVTDEVVAGEETAQAEIEANAATEINAENADAAVKIAEASADAQCEIAKIQADAAVEIAKAENEDQGQWQRLEERMITLERTISELSAQVQSTTAKPMPTETEEIQTEIPISDLTVTDISPTEDQEKEPLTNERQEKVPIVVRRTHWI